jgi:hypothetical protein
MAMISRRGAALLLSVGVSMQLAGCTFIGLGVGSSIQRYRDVPVRDASAVRDCQSARVEFAPEPNHRFERMVEPLSADSENLHMRLRDGHGVTTSWQYVSQVKCRDGTYAMTGAAIGLGIDVLVFLFLSETRLFKCGLCLSND